VLRDAGDLGAAEIGRVVAGPPRITLTEQGPRPELSE
jgi:hypothetical protein